MKKIVLGISAVAFAFALSVSTASAATYSITPSLTIGSTGPEVVELQQMLVAKGYLVMPAGVNMGYFGDLTKQAVIKLQMANAITPAAGFYGPITAAKVNSWEMGGSTSNPSTPGNNSLSGGDGDFKDFEVLGSPNNKDVEEGETMNVFGFEFEADDSDLLVERVDVIASSSNPDVTKPWKVIDEIALVVDGEEVVSVDASDEDNWDEQDDDQYRIRLEDVDWKVEEGESVRAYIAVTASDDVDADEDGEWDISLDTDGVRALNAENIDVYEGDIDDEKTFDIQEATAGDLNISVDDDENDDEEIEISEDDTTDDVTVYTAAVESEDGDNEIDEVTVSLATTTGTVGSLSDIINTLYLFIDGEEVGSESVDGIGTDSVTFDDIDVTIDEDDEVDFVVKADINEQGDNEDNFDNGDGFYVSGIAIDYVDQNDDDATVTDTTDGGNITVSLDALSVDVATTPSAESPVAGDESKGRYFVRFEVTAPDEEDIYIAKGATTSTAVASGQGAEFILVDGSGSTVTGSTTTTTAGNSLLARKSGGSETGNYYKITKGNTATFELDVIVDNAGGPSARTLGIQLTGINYKAGSAAVADVQFTAGLDEDYRSDTEYLLTSNTQN
jgi:hypothetical protein